MTALIPSPLSGDIDTRNDAEQLADKFEAALAHFGLTVHPKATETPQLTTDEFMSLRSKIEVDGLLNAVIVTDEQELLDGRHRLMACYDLGITPDYRVVLGEQAEAAIYNSEARRHQTKSQMAAFTVLFYEDKVQELTAAGVERRKAGIPHDHGDHEVISPVTFTQQTAATGFKISQQAVALLNAGRIDLLVDVRDGKISSMEKAYQQHLDEREGAEIKPEHFEQLVTHLTKGGNAIDALARHAAEIEGRLAFVDDDGSLAEWCRQAQKLAEMLADDHKDILDRLTYTPESDEDDDE